MFKLALKFINTLRKLLNSAATITSIGLVELIRFDLSVISPHHAFSELPQLLLTFPLCFGENILRFGKAIVIIADDNAALPPAVTALSYGVGSAFPFLCQGLSPFPSKRIASDGRPIEVTDTPAGLSESAGIRNSIKQPVMRRDLERAGTEIYVLPAVQAYLR